MLRRRYYIDPHTHAAYFIRNGQLWMAQADGTGRIDPRADNDFTMHCPLSGGVKGAAVAPDAVARDREIFVLLAGRSRNPRLRLRAKTLRFAKGGDDMPPLWPNGTPPVNEDYIVKAKRGRQIAPLALFDPNVVRHPS